VFPEWVVKREGRKGEEIVGIFDQENNIIAIGKPSGGKIKTDRVFIS
jgi:hypothetical protein